MIEQLRAVEDVNYKKEFMDRQFRLEQAKLNAQRCYRVVANAHDFMTESQRLFKASSGEFDTLEALLCAAVTMLAEMHAVMTKDDEVRDLLPGVL